MYPGNRGYDINGLNEQVALLYVEQLHSRRDFAGFGRRFYIAAQGDASLLINYEDHFLIQQLGEGFYPRRLYEKLEVADELLEKYFTYAVSIEMGYLRSRIDKVGNGLDIDVLLHLPALSADTGFDEVLAHAQREDITVSRFGSGKEGSLGHMYQCSCQGILGIDESETLEKLALVVVEFIHYERDARSRLLKNGGLALVDQMWRSNAVAGKARLLNFQESMEMVSMIRLGQSLSQLPASRHPLNALFFLSQPAHLRRISENPEFEDFRGGEQADARLRAALFRIMLN